MNSHHDINRRTCQIRRISRKYGENEVSPSCISPERFIQRIRKKFHQRSSIWAIDWNRSRLKIPRVVRQPSLEGYVGRPRGVWAVFCVVNLRFSPAALPAPQNLSFHPISIKIFNYSCKFFALAFGARIYIIYELLCLQLWVCNLQL